MYKTKRKGTIYEISIPLEWEGETAYSIFKEKWKLPKKLIHQWRMDQAITLNGKTADWQAALKENDALQIPLFLSSTESPVPSFFDMDILYEDDHLLVVNKPAGMKTHPNQEEETNSLLNAVAYHVQLSGECGFIRHVHRLDEQTSGVVLFAKHEAAYTVLSHLLQDRLIKRTYVAAVHGIMQKNKGTINKPVGRDRHHPTRRRISSSGQSALTYFRVLQRNKSRKLSIVECQLATGRTHQIRVHFSASGHPLVGDRLYGGEPLVKRQALHAAKIEIPHPFIGETIVCQSTVPDDIRSLFT
ncbi:RluA family pseudouridine synthase [Bacillus sp. PK3_68]|uniref:RluA family pseudouridine synthase n=1 Tax=Bacillus sp. PK3_68 TaxID=2027408 RepID=UPI000E70FF21|nr:RluA family pseudouridine synthase [Bacillus sp. PK3_68]RJS61637.1 RNA pseudouridine synthase [Bacillus sp. PK3_68]